MPGVVVVGLEADQQSLFTGSVSIVSPVMVCDVSAGLGVVVRLVIVSGWSKLNTE